MYAVAISLAVIEDHPLSGSLCMSLKKRVKKIHIRIVTNSENAIGVLSGAKKAQTSKEALLVSQIKAALDRARDQGFVI